MKVYIAGPMTGLPDHNFPAFHEAANLLRLAGWEVLSPAEHSEEYPGEPREFYLRKDIEMLLQCDAVYLLPGWMHSHGARMEFEIASQLKLILFGSWEYESSKIPQKTASAAAM